MSEPDDVSVAVLIERVANLRQRMDRTDAENEKRWERVEKWITRGIWAIIGLILAQFDKLLALLGAG